MDGTKNSKKYDDKLMMSDALYSQKLITENYNIFANECAEQQIRDIFITILNEEHQIQADVFDEMNKRGWYSTQKAEQQQIQQVKQKFQNMQDS